MTANLDTSVVLRLLTAQPPAQFESARALVAQSARPLSVSDLVVAESYHALRHHYGVPHTDAIDALGALMDDSRIHPEGVAQSVLRDPAARSVSKSAPGFVDRLIHAEAAADSSVLITFDRALAKLPDVQLLG